MRLNCVNILKMPDLTLFGLHPLGAGLRRRFRTSAALWRRDPDESRLKLRLNSYQYGENPGSPEYR